MPLRDAPRLAYDHPAILATAVERVEGKLWWSNVAVGLLPGSSTLAEARAVYAAIAGVAYDPAAFGRDLEAAGLIEPTGDQRSDGPGRPAALLRFASSNPVWAPAAASTSGRVAFRPPRCTRWPHAGTRRARRRARRRRPRR